MTKSRLAVFIRYNLYPITWTILILILCGLPGSDFPDMSVWNLFSFDKFIHLFLFLILVLLSISGFKKQYAYKQIRYNAIKVALGWAFFLGITSEILQGLVFTERSADVYDAIANITGALLGVVAFYFIYGKENTFKFS